MKLAKAGKNGSFYNLTVLENKALLPSQISGALPTRSHYKEMTLSALAGTVEKSGEEYVLTARGSNRKYALKTNDVLKKCVSKGTSKVIVTGKVEERRDMEGRKLLPVIDVTEVQEITDR